MATFRLKVIFQVFSRQRLYGPDAYVCCISQDFIILYLSLAQRKDVKSGLSFNILIANLPASLSVLDSSGSDNHKLVI
jgi:hypothetical protein